VIKIAYTTVAKIRNMAALFTVGNMADTVLDQYILDGTQQINSELGITTSLTAAQIAECNIEGVINNLCAFKCCHYDETLYTNVSAQAMQADIFWAAYQNSLEVLKTQRGRAYEGSFPPTSSNDL